MDDQQQETPDKQAVIYARYSESGTNKDTSLETQIRECERACKYRGWTVVSRHTDKAKSATTEKGRIGFQEAVHQACQLRGTGVLVAYDLSRISRNTINALRLFRKLKDAGVDMFLVSGGCRVDTTDPQWELFWTLLAGMYQYQAAETRKKTVAGLENRRAKGLPTGMAPFGTTAGERKELEWFMWRRHHGWIAADLAAELLFRGYKHRCRKGNAVWWSGTAVANVYSRNDRKEWLEAIDQWRDLPPHAQPGWDEYDTYVNRMIPDVPHMRKRTHPRDGSFIVPRQAVELVLNRHGHLAVDLSIAIKLIRAAVPGDVPKSWRDIACENIPRPLRRRVDTPILETEDAD